mmetsp:Transcript_18320/g.51817  ORF Transcript_18320/g.51817 Transcript_18320/m.51817 type:complete len:95 (+) Transcript_18320:81-365(+)
MHRPPPGLTSMPEEGSGPNLGTAPSGTGNPVDSTGHDPNHGNHEDIPVTGRLGNDSAPQQADSASQAAPSPEALPERVVINITFNINGQRVTLT